MKVAFDQLPDHARLWVYQANRPFADQELAAIRQTIEEFIHQWQAHGKPLTAGYDIRYDQFIVLAVDESMHGATGCSIDGSVALVRQLEQALAMSLLDKSQVAIQKEGELKLFPFNQIKSSVASGEIGTEDMVFNNAVATKDDFLQGWRLPATDSWLKRHFATVQ